MSTMAVPRTSAVAASDRDTVSALAHMFSPTYSASQLSSILRHNNGNIDRAVDMILAHSATDSSPDDLIGQLESTSSCAVVSCVQSAPPPPTLYTAPTPPVSNEGSFASGTKPPISGHNVVTAAPSTGPDGERYRHITSGPDGGAGVRRLSPPTYATSSAVDGSAAGRGGDCANNDSGAALSAIMGGLSDEERELLRVLMAEKQQREGRAAAATAAAETSRQQQQPHNNPLPNGHPNTVNDWVCPPPPFAAHARSAPAQFPPSGPTRSTGVQPPAFQHFVTDGASVSSDDQSSSSFAPTMETMMHMMSRTPATIPEHEGWRGEQHQQQQVQEGWRGGQQQNQLQEGWRGGQQVQSERVVGATSELQRGSDNFYHNNSNVEQHYHTQHQQQEAIPPMPSSLGRSTSAGQPPSLYRNDSQGQHSVQSAHSAPPLQSTAAMEHTLHAPPLSAPSPADLHRLTSLPSAHQSPAVTKPPQGPIATTLCQPPALGRAQSDTAWNSASTTNRNDRVAEVLRKQEEEELKKAIEASIEESKLAPPSERELKETMARSLTETHRRMSESDLHALTAKAMKESKEHVQLSRASSMNVSAGMPSRTSSSLVHPVPEHDVLDEEEQLKKALEASMVEQTGGYRRQQEEQQLRGNDTVVPPPSMPSPPPPPPAVAATLRSAEAPSPAMAAPPAVAATLRSAEASREQEVATSATACSDDTTAEDGFLTVKGCGIDAINGAFEPSGDCNGVQMYVKEGTWNDRTVTFTLYRCWLSSSDRKWFISIVPENCTPGTDQDLDFYCAPATSDFSLMEDGLPPETGWTCVRPYGQSPPPMCLFETVPLFDEAEHDFIAVEGAGTEVANGAYRRRETHDGVGTYGREAFWNGVKVTFTVFRMALGGSEGRMWFMSIVPTGCNPGSNADTDLYTAESSCRGDDVDCNELPPVDGWKVIPGFGQHPPPHLRVEVAEGVVERPLTPPPREFFAKSKGQAETTDGPASQKPQPSVTPPVSHEATPASLRNEQSITLPTATEESDREYARRLSNELNNNDADGFLPPSLPPSNPPPVAPLDKTTKVAPNSEQQCLLVKNELNQLQPRRVAMCIVCKDRPVTHVLVPCGHPCLCEDCASTKGVEGLHGRCPIGRCEFSCVMRFYGTLVEEQK